MHSTATKAGVISAYEAAPSRVRDYFAHFPALVSDFPLDVCLAYVFAQIELAHNMTLYCAVVKKHRADSEMARNAIDVHHMSRSDFLERFQSILGKALPPDIRAPLEAAESVRDKVMHGKRTETQQLRQALVDVISYATAFNRFVSERAGFQPFGPLQGFKGRAQSLDKSTTRWVLKGMGFKVS